MAGPAIPLSRPTRVGGEAETSAAVATAGPLAGGGPAGARCEAALSARLAGARVLLTPSCSSALELAALLLGVGPGDEVVVPPFTFPTTVGAFALRGATVRFADIEATTLALDPDAVAAVVGERTRAVVLVHYGGIPAAGTTDLVGLAAMSGAALVEDAAHVLFASLGGRPLGTFGDLAAFSFHETKNVTCGEGGALVVAPGAHADRFAERAEVLRDKGTDRGRFLRGEVDKYTWVDLGGSHLLSELQAAVLEVQLAAADAVQAARHAVWNRYRMALAPWAAANGAVLATPPPGAVHAAHQFHLLVPDAELRDPLLAHLRAQGIGAAFHFQPLHRSPMGRRLGADPEGCPVADDVAERIVRLPFATDLSDDEVDRVVAAVRSFAALAG